MPILELCSGYGGLGIAVESLTGERVRYVAENDPHASQILATGTRTPRTSGTSRPSTGPPSSEKSTSSRRASRARESATPDEEGA